MGLESEDAYITELQTILRIALTLRDATATKIFHLNQLSPLTNSRHTVIGPINLPSPHPLLPSLLDAGFNREIAVSISEAYQLRAEELKQRIQESIDTACREVTELPVVALASSSDALAKKLAFTLTQLYLRRLEQWKKDIIQRTRQAPKASVKAATRNSRAFNQEYVPLLEHFFEENQFPTHADKMFLAKKSNMEYKQIHVWFQNRRNRTRKEGKALKKKPTCECATKSLNKLYERVKGHAVGSDSQPALTPKMSSAAGATDKNISRDTFASSSPLHAFPSSYPPTCHYDPFPCKSGPVCFGKPKWRRVPDWKPPMSLSISIDNLVNRFSHLSIRDGTRFKGPLKAQSCAATAAITVIPSRAPHPSLIVREYIQPAKIVPPRPSVRAPVSCLKAFRSPSPGATPITLVPLSTPRNDESLRKRKIAPLPQRFPGRMRHTCRDTSPSESSSKSSSSPHLSTTDTESCSCSFSSVSSSSTPDTASVQELPNLFVSPCRPLDSPIHLRRLGDVVASSSASAIS